MFYFLSVIWILLFGREFGCDLTVKGGKVGFKLLQLIFLAPCLGDNAFQHWNIRLHLGCTFLMLGDNVWQTIKGVDKVHTGSMGIGHGYETVVVLIFIAAFNYKAVLDPLTSINDSPLTYYGDWETIYFSDTEILAMRIGTLGQP